MNKDNNKDEQCFIMIDELAGQGIAPTDIAVLKTAGFHTVEAVAYSTKKRLEDIKGINDAFKAEKLQKAAYSIIRKGFEPPPGQINRRPDIVRITTGSKDLDALLGGGIETGSITDLHGIKGCGKTQLVHQLAVSCQLPIALGGTEGKCLFIDTENTFRPERLLDIGDRYNLKKEHVLENVLSASVYNVDHQTQLLHEAARLMSEYRYGLLVVDSVTRLYRTGSINRRELANRQQHLSQFLRMCQSLAEEFGVAVVITHQPMAFSDRSMSGGDQFKTQLAWGSSTRINLRKGKGENRIAQVLDSPLLPESPKASFSIKIDGIHDGETNE